MKPQVVSPRRMPRILLVVAVAAVVGGAAGTAATLLLTRHADVEAAAPAAAPDDTGARVQIEHQVSAHRSKLDRQIDVMSAQGFGPDGNPDDVYEVNLDAAIPVRHIYVTREDQALQWDTVVADEILHFSGPFVGQPGANTWHVGVRENGRWLNNYDGGLRGLIGAHTLELIATSPQGRGPRVISVELTDGSILRATIGD